MKILIKKVGISTYNPETEKISNFWISTELSNGKEIIVYDQLPFVLREFENQELNCLIYLKLSKNPVDSTTKDEPENPILIGKY